jgi:protein-tyrosine phosphatase
MIARICFVCLGNICRSPLAEGIFVHLITSKNISNEFFVASAGVGSWNVGKPPDQRSQEIASMHGITLFGLAKQFKKEDFSKFDWIIAMDLENQATLKEIAPTVEDDAKIHLLREFDLEAGQDLNVPDPYYGNSENFEIVYQIIERSCRNLFNTLIDH